MVLIDFLKFFGFQLLVALLVGFLFSKLISLFRKKTKCYLLNNDESFSLFGKVKRTALLDLFQTHDFRLEYEYRQNGYFKVKDGKEWLLLHGHPKEIKDEDAPEEVGFIEHDGQIYDKQGFNVGFIGNKAGVPTIWGERKWYELFLKCHGFVYLKNKQESIVRSGDGQSGETKQPEYTCIGKCVEYGRFRRPKRMTTLARGAAFTVFSKLYPLPEENKEVILRRYFWHDTVLVSALIFSFIYLTIYLLKDYFTLFSFLGQQIGFIITMTLLFGVIWLIMRTIKIELSLSGQPVEHTLMLFNRNTGVSAISTITIVCAVSAIVLAFFFHGGDFLPLFAVIGFSVWWNHKHASSAPWEVRDDFDKIDEADLDTEEPEHGTVEKKYTWNLDPNFGSLSGVLSISFDEELIQNERDNNPFRIHPYPSNDHYTNARALLEKNAYYRGYLKKIVRYINQRAKDAYLLDIEKMQFILDFVQSPNIEYVEDEKSGEIGNLEEYARTPNETLFDKRGDCDCKAALAATLFREAGYPSVYILLPGHAAIGVAITSNTMSSVHELHEFSRIFGSNTTATLPLSPYLKLNNNIYYFCETTGSDWIIGDYSENTPDKVEKVIYLDI